MSAHPGRPTRVAPTAPFDVNASIPQYGQVLDTRRETTTMQGTGLGAGATYTLNKDCVRWKADDPASILPVRIYLGPWQPQADLATTNPVVGNYALPTPWTMDSNPTRYDNMASSRGIYARVDFGAGMVQHTAFVDWPKRGLLFQVGASYVQVNGYGSFLTRFPATLPIISASMALEPGGGDSPQPATFTYPSQLAVNPTNAIIFQVPPFARAFTPIFNFASGAAANPTTILIQVANGDMAWQFDMTQPNTFPQSMTFPVPGQESGGGGANPEDVVISAPGFVGAFNVGCTFYLDL
jgi:hypothetical protein